MTFSPGQSGNVGGKKRKFLSRLTKADFKKPCDVKALDLIATIVGFKDAPTQLRLQAAAILAPYQELKAHEKVGRDLQLPEATSVEMAMQNLAKIAAEAAADRIAPEIASKLADLQQRYIDARISHDTEARLAAIEQMLERLRPPVDIVVESSMPTMPGLEGVLMPPRTLSVPNGGKGEREP